VHWLKFYSLGHLCKQFKRLALGGWGENLGRGGLEGRWVAIGADWESCVGNAPVFSGRRASGLAERLDPRRGSPLVREEPLCSLSLASLRSRAPRLCGLGCWAVTPASAGTSARWRRGLCRGCVVDRRVPSVDTGSCGAWGLLVGAERGRGHRVAAQGSLWLMPFRQPR